MKSSQEINYIDLIIDQIEQIKEMIDDFDSENKVVVSWVKGAKGGLNESIQRLNNVKGEEGYGK